MTVTPKETKILDRIDKLCQDKDVDPSTKGFLLKLRESYEKYESFSANQHRCLERIESRFSPGEKKKWIEWKQEYNLEHKKEAKILAKYYFKAGYWMEMSSAIWENDEYVPPKDKYMKMSTNKYAKKVLHNYYCEPKFMIGDMVQIRGSNNISKNLLTPVDFRSRICFVIGYNSDLLSSNKGGKSYSVLPAGSSEKINVEERHIMKPNKRGRTS